MIDAHRRKELSQIVQDLAESLDVPASKYEEAKQHYAAVGDWFWADDSELAPFSREIYPQGSFALGTAVRPLREDEYDVDAVCLLDLTTQQVTQAQLKDLVGRRLKHPRSRQADCRDGRKCSLQGCRFVHPPSDPILPTVDCTLRSMEPLMEYEESDRYSTDFVLIRVPQRPGASAQSSKRRKEVRSFTSACTFQSRG